MAIHNQGLMIKRGPNVLGTRPFDSICMFGNDMELNPEQVEWLEGLYDNTPANIPFRFYIHKLTSSNVIPKKCQMVYGAHFTKRYLVGQLEKPIQVPVHYMRSRSSFDVSMKMGKFSNHAIMTSGWCKVVEKFQMEEEAIWCFHFGNTGYGGKLTVLLDRLPE